MGQNIFVGLMAVAALVAGFLGWWFESGRSLKDDEEAKPDVDDTDEKAATTVVDDRKNPTIMDSAKKEATAVISEEKSH